MKKIIAITIAMAVSGTAFATGSNGGGIQAGQQQGQQQQQSSESAASNAGVLSDNTFNNGAIQVGGTYYDGEAARELSGPQVIDQRIEYAGEYKMKNTPNVSAPALTTTMTETCMGSTSVGGSMPGFGVSFGTTWRDGACVRRLDARELNSLGYRLGAKELMCDSDAVRSALLRAGTPCRNDIPELPPVEEAREVVAPAAAVPAKGYHGISVLNADY